MDIDRTKMLRMASTWLVAVIAGTGCGGGGGRDGSGVSSPDPTPPAASPPAVAEKTTATGLWTGTVTDSAGLNHELIGFVDELGDSVWMTPDGRVLDGRLPMIGAGDTIHLRLHTYEQDQTRDPSSHEDVVMRIEDHSRIHLEGDFDHGTVEPFRADMHAAWEHAASLESLAGVYTRSLRSGYTMTLAVTSNGEVTGSDTLGCQLYGAISVPDPRHNLYHVQAEVTSCGERDGQYQGFGALFDADAMQDYMAAMYPFEHGGDGMHAHNGHMAGQTVMRSGTQNLFMFGMYDDVDHHVILDTLAR